MKTWFKFYGQEFLSDPKMLSLTAIQKALWLTMLCLASSSDEEGTIKYINESKIMQLAGIDYIETDNFSGFLTKFEDLGMIKINGNKLILLNFLKRQEINLTEAERAKRYRENKRHVTNVTKKSDERHARIDKNREDKNRIYREIKPESSLSYFLKIPQEDLEEFTKNISCTESMVKSKAEDLYNYCKAKGKIYKDYKAFLLNALKKDFGKRKEIIKFNPEEIAPEIPMEQREANRKKLSEMRENILTRKEVNI